MGRIINPRGTSGVVSRRRAGRAGRATIEATAQAGQAAARAACEALRRQGVDVEALDAAAALRRTLTLLGLVTPGFDKQVDRWLDSFVPDLPSDRAASGSLSPVTGGR